MITCDQLASPFCPSYSLAAGGAALTGDNSCQVARRPPSNHTSCCQNSWDMERPSDLGQVRQRGRQVRWWDREADRWSFISIFLFLDSVLAAAEFVLLGSITDHFVSSIIKTKTRVWQCWDSAIDALLYLHTGSDIRPGTCPELQVWSELWDLMKGWRPQDQPGWTNRPQSWNTQRPKQDSTLHLLWARTEGPVSSWLK